MQPLDGSSVLDHRLLASRYSTSPTFCHMRGMSFPSGNDFSRNPISSTSQSRPMTIRPSRRHTIESTAPPSPEVPQVWGTRCSQRCHISCQCFQNTCQARLGTMGQACLRHTAWLRTSLVSWVNWSRTASSTLVSSQMLA